MANLGKVIKKSFEKKTLTSTTVGIIISTLTTVAPMFLVIGGILILYSLLNYNTVVYSDRVLFSSSILYIFIFSLLTTSPFNSILSRYMTDRIFEERYDAILPCFYGGLFLNMMACCAVGIPFYLYAHFVGGIELLYIFLCFITYIGLSLTFYTMLFLSITKDYSKISLFFALGVGTMIACALFLVRILHVNTSYGMLTAIAIGFLVMSSCECAYVKGYFHSNDGSYFEFMGYFKKYWQLSVTNLLYTLGMYAHNFVFWTVEDHLIVKNTYVCYPPYDMATCIAMFTNISASVILITQIELHFHERYKAYSEAVIGGRLRDITKAKNRMFSLLSYQLMDVVRNQFIISVILYLLCVVFLPQFGFAGQTMEIYPCLAAGYFVIFLLYSCIIFLFYFNDKTGSCLATLVFCAVTTIVSIFAREFSAIWYGIGTFAGAFAGWCIAYFRLRWVERNLDEHIFCQGKLIPEKHENMPSGIVFSASLTTQPDNNEKGSENA
ncbi:MAG: exopolysaccharide Pel transporter PelG [Clostridiaceae bacterium]|nr:exopolysaccharide Pel transporter PelG [Clostridiaceae bacterium]